MNIKSPKWVPTDGAGKNVALEVLRHGPMSRSEVARRLSLSAGSLTRLSTPLIESGLLIDVGEQSGGKVGRPSQLIDIVPGSQRFIGMKLTANKVLGVTTDLRGKVIVSASAELLSQDVVLVVSTIAKLVKELLEKGPSVTAIGIGVGAQINSKGVIISAPFLGWSNVDLGSLVEKSTGLLTIVENDLVAFTEYEHWFGAGQKAKTFAVVTLGAGIGYGLIANDRILANKDHGIGLIGHWPLDPFGPVCSEGHRGCAKAILTDTAISSAVSLALGRPVNYDEALNLADKGELAAVKVVNDAGFALGKLLAAIANLVMPELIVLGGEGVRIAKVAAEKVQEGLAMDRALETEPLILIQRSGDNTEWCRGAAVVAIQAFVLGSRIGRI